MAADEDKRNDFYAVLGLKKECSAAELRNAYKGLAMKWHPDRCSASGNSKHAEEAKKKFQAIQEAYSVLSDDNKRFLYDVGIYDCDDDEDENGMGDFLHEMVAMMNQNKSSENGEESFEDLQGLFEEMFQSDIDAIASSSRSTTPSVFSSSSLTSCSESCNSSNKRNSSSSIKAETIQFEGFCMGAEHQEYMRRARGTGARAGAGTQEGAGSSKRREGRKQKVSFGHDVSSNDYSGVSFS